MEPISCPNPDCRIAETGKCVEGFSVQDCPHQKVQKTQSAVKSANGDDSPETKSSENRLPSGDILSIDEANNVLRSRKTYVIAVIGPVASGKTTFGVSLYDAFQHSNFSGWSFAGSLTLRGFEKRCHFARMECGRIAPSTPRTSTQDGLGFLHLGLYSANEARVDLLISDRSGEYYAAAADSAEDCKNLFEIYRADLVLFLLDGNKIASDERHGVKHDIVVMFAALIESQVLTAKHRIAVALTKYDLVLKSQLRERAEKDFDNIIDELRRRHPNIHEILPMRIAARPENDTIELRYGISEILKSTMVEKAKDYHNPEPLPINRIFWRLNVRSDGEA